MDAAALFDLFSDAPLMGVMYILLRADIARLRGDIAELRTGLGLVKAKVDAEHGAPVEPLHDKTPIQPTP